jgi:hypothetical protein
VENMQFNDDEDPWGFPELDLEDVEEYIWPEW